MKWETAAGALQGMGAKPISYDPMLDYWLRMASGAFALVGTGYLLLAIYPRKFSVMLPWFGWIMVVEGIILLTHSPHSRTSTGIAAVSFCRRRLGFVCRWAWNFSAEKISVIKLATIMQRLGKQLGEPKTNWPLRLACEKDIPALEVLIPLSVRVLQAAHYSTAQMEAALGPVFGVDRQLILDGTYFIVEEHGQILGCGGWSRRKAMFGGDRDRAGEDGLLDPKSEPARIRAFFIHPYWARRGIGRSILAACEAAIYQAGFQTIELVATLAGEPLYAANGYSVVERYEVPMSDGLTLPVVRMVKI